MLEAELEQIRAELLRMDLALEDSRIVRQRRERSVHSIDIEDST